MDPHLVDNLEHLAVRDQQQSDHKQQDKKEDLDVNEDERKQDPVAQDVVTSRSTLSLDLNQMTQQIRNSFRRRKSSSNSRASESRDGDNREQCGENDNSDEEVDPRIEHKLEELNNWNTRINSLEQNFIEANNNYRAFLTEWSDKLRQLARKIGQKNIDDARPYHVSSTFIS